MGVPHRGLEKSAEASGRGEGRASGEMLVGFSWECHSWAKLFPFQNLADVALLSLVLYITVEKEECKLMFPTPV